MTYERKRKFADFFSWFGTAMLMVAAIMDVTQFRFLQSGICALAAFGSLAIQIGSDKFNEYHLVRMEAISASRDEGLADVRRAMAEAQMAEVALSSMQKHAANGGEFAFRPEINVMKRSGGGGQSH